MLIVDDKWLLLGPNRHGNTFSKLVVEAGFPGRTRMIFHNKHWPLCKIPEHEREGKIIVGIIRSPLDWYVCKWCVYRNDHVQSDFPTFYWRHWDNPHGQLGKNTEDLPLSPAGIGAWSYQTVAYNCLDARRALAEIKTQDDLAKAWPKLCSLDETMFTHSLRKDLPRVFGDCVRSDAEKRGIPNSSYSGDCMVWYTPEIIENIRRTDGWLVKFYPHLPHADKLGVFPE